jgi:hypothetical protein
MSGMKRMKMERPPFIEGGVCPVMMTAAAVAGRRGGGRLAFKDDASYIGYLTDDESGSGSDSDGGSSMEMVYRRRRDELLGNNGGFDLSFSVCLFVIVALVVLVWGGLRPPTALYCSGVAP